MKTSTKPCVNEPTPQPDPAIQETLGKKNSGNNEPLNHPFEVTLTSPMPTLTHANHLNQETSGITSEAGSTIQIQLAFLKENGTISIMCNDKTLSDAIVLGCGRKSTGKNKSSINV